VIGRQSVDGALSQVEQQTTDCYEAAYFRDHRIRYKYTLTQIDHLLSRRHGAKVLDVGCFPYHMGAAMDLLGYQVFGISSRHESVNHERVSVLDIETDPFPWPDDFFDLILFGELLEHLVHSPVPPLNEMKRVLRPDGHLVLTTPNLASARQRLLLLKGKTIMFPVDLYFAEGGRGVNPLYRHNREYTLSDLRTLLRRGGWQIHQASQFMAYPDMFSRQDASWPRRTAVKWLKLAPHLLLPGAEDSLLAVATPSR
jgi:SAM-dependent methyltransferase